MSNWDELNLQQKAELMKIYTANGFNSLGGIIEHYNKFIDGGNITESVVTNKIPILERIGNKFIKVLRTPKDYSDEVTDITECAKFSNNRVREIVGKRPYGHAWTRSNNNVETIISGYDGLDRPSEYNRKDVLDYIFDAATNVKRNINLKDLQEGDIVGMYYRGSPNQFTAYTDGANGEAQTHTGHIVYRKNKPYVEHNVHGDITLNKVKDVLGKNRPYGIVSISRMKANGGPLDWLLSQNGNAINYGTNGNIPIVRYDDGGFIKLP